MVRAALRAMLDRKIGMDPRLVREVPNLASTSRRPSLILAACSPWLRAFHRESSGAAR